MVAFMRRGSNVFWETVGKIERPFRSLKTALKKALKAWCEVVRTFVSNLNAPPKLPQPRFNAPRTGIFPPLCKSLLVFFRPALRSWPVRRERLEVLVQERAHPARNAQTPLARALWRCWLGNLHQGGCEQQERVYIRLVCCCGRPPSKEAAARTFLIDSVDGWLFFLPPPKNSAIKGIIDWKKMTEKLKK